MGLHDGHRKRLTERAIRESLDNFNPHNIIELLLFFGIPRKDTNEIAHVLLDTFGSVSGVMDAPMEELVKIKGMGEHSASLVKLIPLFARAYLTDRNKDIILDDVVKVGEYLKPRYIGRNEEVVFLVCTDSKCKVLNTSIIHHGSVNAVEINIHKIIDTAIKYKATGVILSHNHPGGNAAPSKDDINTTMRIKKALENISIPLIDHIIVADDDFVSLKESGVIGVVY